MIHKMKETWFISDTHFSHKNIIKYCNRPFSSIEEMDETLIANWNSRVKPNDTVFHLGDFAFSKQPERYLERLNGNITLIRGNHDHDNIVNALAMYSNIEIVDYKEISIANRTIVMLHYPMYTWNKKPHGAIHLYGHVHNGNNFDLGIGNSAVNMCVEWWKYAPVNISDILNLIAARNA